MAGGISEYEYTAEEVLKSFITDLEAEEIWFSIKEDKAEIIKTVKDGRVFTATVDFSKKEVVVTEDVFRVLHKAKFDDVESMKRFLEGLEESVRAVYEHKKKKVLDTVKKLFKDCIVDVVRSGYLLRYESIVANLFFIKYPREFEKYHIGRRYGKDVYVFETNKADVIYYIYKLIAEFVEASERNDLESMIITSAKAKFIINMFVKKDYKKVLEIFKSLVMKMKLLRLELNKQEFMTVVSRHLRILETILRDVLKSEILSRSELFRP